jgi:hypothetical protein
MTLYSYTFGVQFALFEIFRGFNHVYESRRPVYRHRCGGGATTANGLLLTNGGGSGGGHGGGGGGGLGGSGGGSAHNYVYPPPPVRQRWPLAWVLPVLAVGDEELLALVGMDSYVMIRYIKLCWNLFSFSTVLCLCVLVPVYRSGGETANLDCSSKGESELSFSQKTKRVGKEESE